MELHRELNRLLRDGAPANDLPDHSALEDSASVASSVDDWTPSPWHRAVFKPRDVVRFIGELRRAEQLDQAA
jgi:hypothetical protein